MNKDYPFVVFAKQINVLMLIYIGAKCLLESFCN